MKYFLNTVLFSTILFTGLTLGLIECNSNSSKNVQRRSMGDTTSKSVSMHSIGIYQAKSGEKIESANTSTGHLTDLYDLKLSKSDQNIQPKVGDVFGFQFVFKEAAPSDAEGGEGDESANTPVIPDSFLVKVFHPEMTNPESAEKFTESSWTVKTRKGQPNWVGWFFEHDWEIVPGQWTFQVLNGEEVIVSRNFTVTSPQPENEGQ